MDGEIIKIIINLKKHNNNNNNKVEDLKTLDGVIMLITMLQVIRIVATIIITMLDGVTIGDNRLNNLNNHNNNSNSNNSLMIGMILAGEITNRIHSNSLRSSR